MSRWNRLRAGGEDGRSSGASNGAPGRTPLRGLLLIGALGATAAAAPTNRCAHVGGVLSAPLLSVKDRQDMRFPQVVRVGSLRDEHVIMAGNRLRQLGVIVGVFKPTDDDPELVFRYGGVLGLGARTVAPPLEEVDAVGPYLKIISLDKKDLQALPTFKPADGAFLAPNDTICLGVDRKY